MTFQVLDTDGADLRSLFQETLEFIDHARKLGNVLVHCVVGASRSATIILAYLITKKKITLQQALAYLIDIRPIVNPNCGFIVQLLEHER